MRDLPENHRFEQFFFDATTTARLSQLARSYRRPLLLCMPSLAQALAQEKHPYLLLDRDTRFKYLPHYHPFDLFQPHLLFEDIDAIFCDPPFSNISLPQLHTTLDLLARSAPRRRPPLYLCYISSREDALQTAFPLDTLQRLPGGPLGYLTVSPATQARIYLYGPPPLP